jgi:hypothetical protein
MALEGYIITDNGRIVLLSGYYKVDGKVVKPPVDIDELPAGKYRLMSQNI